MRLHKFSALVLTFGVLTTPLVSAQSSADSDSKAKATRKSASTLVVKGVAIDRSKFEFLLVERVRGGQADSPALREAVANELVQRELLMVEARRKGLDRQAQTRVQQDLASDRVLATLYINQYLSENPVTEEAVKREFDDFVKRAGNEEVLIRQILLPNLEDAKGVLARLTAGEKFDELAVKLSRDAASRQQGGLIGWVPTALLQPKIAEAVKSLSKGSMSKEAIQSPAGWHVVRLEDKRPFTKPNFEAVRSQIQLRLQQKAIDEHLNSLFTKSQNKG